MTTLKKILAAGLIIFALRQSVTAQTNYPPLTPGAALILYDSSGEYGWIGGIHGEMLGNLLGHFPGLPYEIMPVESYRAGDVNLARVTFYFGSVYANPLPAAFTNDVYTTSNTVCWFKYNVWQIDDANFEAKVGFHFIDLDWSGYSNIVYKGESFSKDQLDPELGDVSIVNTNLASTPAIAAKADGTSIPYVTAGGGHFWYIADSPFDYMEEQDRYIAFCDVLHDIVGIDAPTNHQAVIRIEDVAPTMYDPATLMATADLLASNNVPFCIALVPIYTDPLGVYNDGIPETHRMSDTNDPDSVAFVGAIRYMVSKGAQLIMHGYTHQYSNVDNPYTGVSGDDFEFWRETFDTNSTVVGALDLYEPIPEDSVSWAQARLTAGKQEVANVGLSLVGFENPHYAGSVIDYQVITSNFPMAMERALYFDNAGHIAGQFYPYPVKDLYGMNVMGESIGNIEPVPWLNYPAHSAQQMVADAYSTLVVRDGWANGYFHPFYDLTNLQAVITGVKALGYTYVKPSTAEPPSIIVEPANTNSIGGTTATLTVAAVGTSPLSYQWKRNGTNVAGGTAATLSIPIVQTNNAGSYTVVISNAFGLVTSSTALLTVQLTVPFIVTQPASRTNAVGTAASFAVVASGATPLRYQWRFNNANLARATNTTYSIASVQATNVGSYTVVVTNSFGAVTSAVATLSIGTAPVITAQPASRTNAVATAATFSVTATGTAPLAYHWRFNAANIANATNATYTIANVQTNNAGTYTVVVTNAYGSATSAGAVLTVKGSNAAPAIVTQPVSQTVAAGTNVTLSVVATGSTPLGYHWRLAGKNLGGGAVATFVMKDVQPSDSGNYDVVVSNAYGMVTSAVAVITVASPPVFSTQPKSSTNAVGASVTLSWWAAGAVPVVYEVKFNGNIINVTTNSWYDLNSLTTNNAGSYVIVATNGFGSATSATATVTVISPPVITTQPKALTVTAGSPATFSVVATGTPPLTYQWKFGGANITGATNSSYTISSVTTNNAGNYKVAVASHGASVTSSAATLTVH